MVTSRRDGDVVWLVFDGPLSAADAAPEINKWLSQKDSFTGFISDVRKMTDQSAIEQKKLAEWRKENRSGKPNAILGKDNAMSVLVKIFINFTRSEDTRYFTDIEEAKSWIRSYKK